MRYWQTECPRWEKDKRLSERYVVLLTRRPNDRAELTESEGYRTRNNTLTLYNIISDISCLFCLGPKWGGEVHLLLSFRHFSSRALTVYLILFPGVPNIIVSFYSPSIINDRSGGQPYPPSPSSPPPFMLHREFTLIHIMCCNALSIEERL